MKTAVISGFGGGYEWACQKMLQLGIEFLKQHPDFKFEGSYKENPNVHGICLAENEPAKQLDDAIMRDPKLQEGGVTGAMHHTVIHHLMYIHNHGQEKWLEEMAKSRRAEEIFEFDGTERSIPLGEYDPPHSPAKRV